MKFHWLAVGIVPTLCAPIVWAQTHNSLGNPQNEVHGRLMRVQPRSADDVDESRTFDRDDWRKRLTQSDLDQRMRDFEMLVNRARRDKAVHEAVEAWAHDAANA
jgi:hypothetical protein